MRFLKDGRGVTAIEYIVVGAIVLIVVGASIWQVAGSIADRFTDFNNSL